MKKSRILLVVPALLALTLVACGGEPAPVEGGWVQADATNYKTNFNTLRKSAGYHTEVDQVGNIGIFAVPVDFSDYPASKLPLGTEGSREAIRVSLFGDPVNNQEDRDRLYSHSLKSYYNESSFGKCKMDGVVTKWWHMNQTVAKFDKGNESVHDHVVQPVMDYYRNDPQGKKELEEMGYDGNGDGVCDMRDFDRDGDGFVDLVTFVYSCPVGDNQVPKRPTDTFWAWTTQFNRSPDEYFGDVDNPKFSRFWWSSYEFMYDSGYYDEDGEHHFWTLADKKANRVKFSANTFIHETGHGLGLPDYYSYDKKESPLGGLDMMDYNIGDHNAVSKSLYRWIAPKVVTGDCDIVLNASELSGDCLMIPIRKTVSTIDEKGNTVKRVKDWKKEVNTLLDEYLMLEFVTGQGVATKDSTYNYYSPDMRDLYFNEPGVRILHADLRIGAFDPNSANAEGTGMKFLGYIDSDVVNKGYRAKFAHDNTPSRTVNGNSLLELVLPSGDRNVTGTASNKTLFREGDTLNNFAMNTVREDGKDRDDKYNLGYNITIGKINGSENVVVKVRVAE